jgi:adenosylcobinamide-GDP ribazoletransferase
MRFTSLFAESLRRLRGDNLNSFLLVLQMLTRIPINKNLPCDKNDFKGSTFFFPLVGFIIGTLTLAVYMLSALLLPPIVSSILAFTAMFMITGGMHIDGLADCSDGFFAFRDKEGIMNIMKDSRVGTFGAIAITFDLLIRVAAFSTVALRNGFWLLLVMPLIGRACILLICAIGKPAKAQGSGNLFIGNTYIGALAIAIGIAFLCSAGAGYLIFGIIGIYCGLIAVILAMLTTYLFNIFSNRKISGITGDCLGAACEISEITALLVFTACLKFI